jgi:hypothetical protein
MLRLSFLLRSFHLKLKLVDPFTQRIKNTFKVDLVLVGEILAFFLQQLFSNCGKFQPHHFKGFWLTLPNKL